MRLAASGVFALLLAACQPGGGASVPGDAQDTAAFSGIAPDETIRFVGTEPFWGGQSKGESLTYTTPENPQGSDIFIKRFAGRGGLSLSGKLGGKPFDMTITPGACSDGMSDRSYPFAASLLIGENALQGCAWTDRHGFTGSKAP